MSKSNDNQPKEIPIYSDEFSKTNGESKSNIDTSPEESGSGPNSPVTHILNDHCLIQIFEYLPLWDLCSVAEVCRMFHSNAVFVFENNFSNFDVNSLIDDWNDWDNNDDDYEEEENEFPVDLVEKAFRIFGIYMQSIHLDQEDLNENQRDKILEFMATFCSNKDAVLNKLAMYDVTICGQFIQDLQPLFARLQFLEIAGGIYDYRNHILFSDCSELIELILENVNFGTCFKRKYKKLERISLVDISETYKLNVGAFNDFVTMNPQLRSLTITDTDGPSTQLSPHFYNLVGSMSELEELNLHTNKKILYKNVMEDLNQLAKLRHLKSFSFNCLWLPVEQLFNNFAKQNVPVENLDLRNLSLSSNITTSLSKLTQMRSIRFYDGETKSGQLPIVVKGMLQLEKLFLCNFEHVTVDDIIGIVQNAGALSELQLFHQNDIVIGVKEFNKIGQAFKNRRNNNMLNLNIIGDGCMLNVPARLIKENSFWLNVQVTTFNNSAVIDIIQYYGSDEDDAD